MKQFLKQVAAATLGALIAGAVFGLVTLIGLIGMVTSSSGQDATVADGSVMVIRLSGILEERSEIKPLGELLGQGGAALGLDDVLTAIKKARRSDKVRGIYIEAGGFVPDSYASLTAIRRELEAFRKSGKWVVAYADSYTQGAYYVASAADKVYLNPQGLVDWHGVAAQPVYYKDMLEKLGVKVQVAKVGTYKSAVEPFTATAMSDANREQVAAYIGGIWHEVCTAVGASRKLTEAQLNTYADSLVALADAKECQRLKLVDGLLYTDQVKAEVKKLLGAKPDERIKQATVSAVCQALPDDDDGGEVAIYYAYGSIVDGVAGGMSREHVIDAQTVCRDLEALMDDDDVKAVVLRVNSGGGSSYASEQLWHSVSELNKRKPVVVSMGGMAASGAYYMSAPARWLVAEPTTLTGSIGIFGMFPDMSGLLQDKLGITFDEVKTNRHSAFGTPMRPFTPEEMAHLEAYIDRGYKLFRQRVADGRHMKADEVEKIAQGRVWLGSDALRVRLIDQVGSLDDATNKAAQLARLDEYHTRAYPAKRHWSEQLFDAVGRGNYLDDAVKAQLGPMAEPLLMLRNLDRMDAIQARVPFSLRAE